MLSIKFVLVTFFATVVAAELVTEDYGVVKYGAKDNSYAKIKIQHTGYLVDLTLKHITGELTCKKTFFSLLGDYSSYWGCNIDSRLQMMTVITRADNKMVVLPVPETTEHDQWWKYMLPEYDIMSEEIRLLRRNEKLAVTTGEELHIWYSEDLLNHAEENNDGLHEIRVIGKVRTEKGKNCAKPCPRIYVPVCGSDGKTYSNKCVMEVEACKSGKEIKVAKDGACSKNCMKLCPRIYAPVCGSDGKTYSNKCVMEVEACKSGKQIKVVKDGACKPEPPKKLIVVTENYGKVTYRAKGKQSFAAIQMKSTGYLVELTLKHISGSIKCTPEDVATYWGCKLIFTDKDFMTIVTRERTGKVILPVDKTTKHTKFWSYGLPGFNVNSAELQLVKKGERVAVEKGEVLRIWHSEALFGIFDFDNSGEHTIEVIAKVMTQKEEKPTEKPTEKSTEKPTKPTEKPTRMVTEEYGVVRYGKTLERYATVTVKHTGLLKAIKMEHISGALSCLYKKIIERPYWGCPRRGVPGSLMTLITNERNEIIFPNPEIRHDTAWGYILPGYTIDSKMIKFVAERRMLRVVAGEKLKIWFSRDFMRLTDRVGEGIHTVKVSSEIMMEEEKTETGVWSEWVLQTLCTVSCGGGLMLEKRTCLKKPCVGESQRSSACATMACPANPEEEIFDRKTTLEHKKEIMEFCSKRPSGVYPDPKNCKKYIDCRSRIVACPMGLYFDKTTKKCVASNVVKCSAVPKKELLQTVCYGAKERTPGIIKIKTPGRLVSIKLRHVKGSLTCNNKRIDTYTKWGCNTRRSDQMNMMTVITTSDDHVLFPKPGATVHDKNWSYILPGYGPNSPEVILTDPTQGIVVTSGEELKIWYSPVLMGKDTRYNAGKHCVEVYTTTIEEPTRTPVDVIEPKTFCKRQHGRFPSTKCCSAYFDCRKDLMVCPTGKLFDQGKCVEETKVKCEARPVVEETGLVCYGARKNTFGTFKVQTTGKLLEMKLTHVNGYLNCNNHIKAWRSNWGCNVETSDKKISTVITRRDNKVIFPSAKQCVCAKCNCMRDNYFYRLPGFNVNSQELVFKGEETMLSKGEELRIFYGEDLTGSSTYDNEGKHCVRIQTRILRRE